MTAADNARQRARNQVMMAAMSGFVRWLTRSEARRLAGWAALLPLAVAAGCSIDSRNVQSAPSDTGAAGPAGALGDRNEGEPPPGTGEGSALEGNGSGSGAAPPSSGDSPFGGTASGNPGLPGAAGSSSGEAGGLPGDCTAGSQRCQDGTLYVCNEGRMWAALGTACGQCVPDAAECSGSTLRVCSSTGVWIDRLQCAGSQPVCQAASGSCVCSESSCPLGQICSSETFTCEQQLSDCPVPSPIAVSDDHNYGIVSVRFDADTGSADVRLQNISTGILFFDTVLCNGPSNCVPVQDQVTLQLNPRQTVDVTIPDTRPEGGELAFLDDVPEAAILALAYVAWGTGPSSDRFEALANEFMLNNWRPGDRIQVAPGDSGFVCTGNANEAAGFTSCNPLRFTP